MAVAEEISRYDFEWAKSVVTRLRGMIAEHRGTAVVVPFITPQFSTTQKIYTMFDLASKTDDEIAKEIMQMANGRI